MSYRDGRLPVPLRRLKAGSEFPDTAAVIIGRNKEVIATITPAPWRDATANLFIAAPAALEALRKAFAALEEAGNHFDHDNPGAAKEAIARYFELWSDDGRAAIAKAEGR